MLLKDWLTLLTLFITIKLYFCVLISPIILKDLILLKKFALLLVLISLISCTDKPAPKVVITPAPVIVREFGFVLNDYRVIRDTIKKNESFGEILDKHHVPYPLMLEMAKRAKDTFDIRYLRAGKPYTILARKDSTEQAQVFIYQQSKARYIVFDFKDSIHTVYKGKKPVKTVIKTASGVIKNSLYQELESQGLGGILAVEMADVYAWTIDFSRIQKNDSFKIIYEEKYINDTIYAGLGSIKAAYFKHGKQSFYAFDFVSDSIMGISDYFDDQAKTLRRQFLKMPIKFGRISSRYNLRRRIAYYGNRVRPHKGTDFAAAIGTPIMATANGTIVESRYKGGNGNYVKVRHNGTYSTQYLHMKKRNVRVGDVVKQGDIIGTIGMTGNTGGPHVCYRFWKNGKQVDPLRQKLPAAKPMKDSIKPIYFEFIQPIKEQLDAIAYPSQGNEIKIPSDTLKL